MCIYLCVSHIYIKPSLSNCFYYSDSLFITTIVITTYTTDLYFAYDRIHSSERARFLTCIHSHIHVMQAHRHTIYTAWIHLTCRAMRMRTGQEDAAARRVLTGTRGRLHHLAPARIASHREEHIYIIYTYITHRHHVCHVWRTHTLLHRHTTPILVV